MTEEPPWTADTFAHAPHQRLPCLTCHDPRSTRKLTFEPGRGCQICHHQSPDRNDCTACHAPAELAAAAPVTVIVAVAGTPPLARTTPFDHSAHRSRACTACHSTPVTLAPASAAGTCTACHDAHASPTASCAACHGAAAPFAAHRPPADAHRACAACHAAAIVAALAPTRQLCLTCHAPQRDHEPTGECTTCHLAADPATYRSHLAQGAAR